MDATSGSGGVADPLGRVAPYLDLMRRFDSGTLSVGAFERTYIDRYLADPTMWSDELYDVLNEVFLDVDAYNPNSAALGEWDIDEVELRRRVRLALQALEDLAAVRV